jgi:hypothetical protein
MRLVQPHLLAPRTLICCRTSWNRQSTVNYMIGSQAPDRQDRVRVGRMGRLSISRMTCSLATQVCRLTRLRCSR